MLFEFDDFVLDESAYELRRGTEVLKVDHKAFGMLAYLLRRPGQLVTKEELVNGVWEGRALSDTVLSGTVSRLRKALSDGPREDLVVSVYGRGYRFVGTVRERARLVRQANDLPFVGRSAAMARVQRCLEQARAGRGRIVALAGEPGIGKTQLAEVAADKASELGMLSAWGYCREHETAPPFWPFVQLLRGSLRAGGSSASRTAVDSALSALTPERSSAGWGSDATGYRLLEGVAHALLKMADDAPLLLVLDDLQWADAASLRLLAYLAPEIARMPMVILATVRNTDIFPTDGRLRQVLAHRQCEHIELDRLTPADVAEYTEAWLGSPAHDVSEAVFDTSAGNPFFMVELLRPFRNQGPPRIDELELTGPALDIVRQRIRTLGPEATSVLSVAAVVGSDFDLGLLAYVAELDPRGLVDTLESACKTSTILASADRPGHFTFGHDLIRSVLLEELPASQRARLHLRAAELLERRHPVGDGIPPTELVHHLLSALPLGDVLKTVEYTRRAALGASAVCAHADAADLLRRALAALEMASDAHPRLRADLLLGLSLCERAYADDRFPAHLAEAVALGREHGLGDILAEAGRHMSLAPGFMTLKGAREVLEAADRALPADDLVRRSRVLTHLAWTAPYCFDAGLVAPLVARAEALARASRDPTALAAALSAKIYFANGPGSRDLADATARQIDLLYADSSPLVRVYWSAQIAVLAHRRRAAARRHRGGRGHHSCLRGRGARAQAPRARVASPPRRRRSAHESRRLRGAAVGVERAPRPGQRAASLLAPRCACHRLDRPRSGDRLDVEPPVARDLPRGAGGRLPVPPGAQDPLARGARRERGRPDGVARARPRRPSNGFLATGTTWPRWSISPWRASRPAARPTPTRSTRSCRPIRTGTRRTSASTATGRFRTF